MGVFYSAKAKLQNGMVEKTLRCFRSLFWDGQLLSSHFSQIWIHVHKFYWRIHELIFDKGPTLPGPSWGWNPGPPPIGYVSRLCASNTGMAVRNPVERDQFPHLFLT